MRSDSLKLFFAVFLVCLSGTIYAQDPNFHIYLCFGQSNMEGAAPLEAQDRTGNNRIQVMGAVNCSAGSKSYTVGKWANYAPSTVRCNTGLGPSDYFARTMVANLPAEIKIGLVPVAIGGCDIALFDKVNYASYVATAPDWMKGTINMYGGNPYGRLVEVAKAAQRDGVIKGILLHQGETNNGQADWPVKVKAIYDNLIKDLGLDPAKTPLLVGETLYQNQGGACYHHNNIISRMPGVIPNSHVISANGLAGFDQFHFTSSSYRIFGQRYAEKMLTLVDRNNGMPAVSLVAPLANETFISGTPVVISATASDPGGSIAKVEFYAGTTLIGTDISSPYSFTWIPATAGVYSLSAKATDYQNNVSTSGARVIIVNPPQGPYNGTVHAIPGTIQFEAYDVGGNGFAYLDNTPGSAVTPVVNFRTNEDVDIENCTDTGGGYNIGFATAGEWLEYTVNVQTAGTYHMDLRVACNGEGRTLSVSMDGTNIANNVAIPNTTGWQTWQTVRVSDIALTAGQKIMRVTIGATDYVNMNFVTFALSNNPPTVSITAPANNSTYTTLQTVTLTATASDADGNIASVSFYSGTTLLGTDNTSPYSYTWSGMPAGTHTITAKATDDKGGVTTSAPVTVIIQGVQSPFNTSRHTIPGRIEAEEYDLGGEGLGYHEANMNGNQGGATFRNDEVDIEATGDSDGEYNISYILQDEWLEYSVEVQATGTYDLDVRVASDGAGKTFHIEIDGVDVTGPITVPNTGGWQIWTTVGIPDIHLTEGNRQMRIVFDSSYINLNYMEFNEIITSLDDQETLHRCVYPNPASGGDLYIRISGAFNYKIVNSKGSVVEEGQGQDEKVVGSKLVKGIYILLVDNYESVINHTIIIQ